MADLLVRHLSALSLNQSCNASLQLGVASEVAESLFCIAVESASPPLSPARLSHDLVTLLQHSLTSKSSAVLASLLRVSFVALREGRSLPLFKNATVLSFVTVCISILQREQQRELHPLVCELVVKAVLLFPVVVEPPLLQLCSAAIQRLVDEYEHEQDDDDECRSNLVCASAFVSLCVNLIERKDVLADPRPFIQRMFELALQQSVRRPCALQRLFASRLLPSLCATKTLSPATMFADLDDSFAKQIFEYLVTRLAQPASSVALPLLVRYFMRCSALAPEPERFYELVRCCCLDGVCSTDARLRKLGLYMLRLQAEHRSDNDDDAFTTSDWLLYVAIFEQVEARSVHLVAQSWTSLPLLLRRCRGHSLLESFVNRLLELALQNANTSTRRAVLTSVLSSTVPLPLSFTLQTLLPLLNSSAYLSGVCYGQKASIEIRRRQLTAYLSACVSNEGDAALEKLVDCLVHCLDESSMAGHNRLLACELEFVADHPSPIRFVDDALLCRLVPLVSMSMSGCTAEDQKIEHDALLRLLIARLDVASSSPQPLCSLLAIMSDDVVYKHHQELVQLLNADDWLEASLIPALAANLALDRDSHRLSRGLAISVCLLDPADAVRPLVASALTFMADSHERPYAVASFCRASVLSFLLSLLRQSSRPEPVDAEIVAVLHHRAPAIVQSLISCKDETALPLLDALITSFPSVPSLTSLCVGWRSDAFSLLRETGDTASASRALRLLMASLRVRPCDRVFECLVHLCSKPALTCDVWLCLARALRFDSSARVPNASAIVEAALQDLALYNDSALTSIISSLACITYYDEVVERLPEVAEHCFDAISSSRQCNLGDFSSDLFEAVLPPRAFGRAELHTEGGAISRSFAIVMRSAKNHFPFACKLSDHLLPLLLRHANLALHHIPHLLTLATLYDVCPPGDDLFPFQSHVRLSTLALIDGLVNSSSLFCDAFAERLVASISADEEYFHAYPNSKQCRLLVLQTHALALVCRGLSKASTVESVYSFLSRVTGLGLSPPLRQGFDIAFVRLLVSFPAQLNRAVVDMAALLDLDRAKLAVSAIVCVTSAVLEVGADVLSNESRRLLLRALCLRCSHNAGLIRSTSQYMLWRLRQEWSDDEFDDEVSRELVAFHSQQKDSKSIVRRMQRSMDRFRLLHFSSLDGIRELAADADKSYSFPALEGLKNAVGEVLRSLKTSEGDFEEDDSSGRRATKASAASDAASIPMLNKDDGVNDDESSFRTFQRKLEPVLELYDRFGREERARSLTEAKYGVQRSSSPLIVLASLVSKAPNLGGLARTAEIFGVERLVVHDRSVVEDARFQAVAVTAEKWIPISQVRVDDIEAYLIGLKKSGYTVVALEQTADSVSLEAAEFPEKTVLLLGKEREGVPAPLLHVVDWCVEIPQQGVVRSLNVHVSAAVCMWHYTQHRLKLAAAAASAP